VKGHSWLGVERSKNLGFGGFFFGLVRFFSTRFLLDNVLWTVDGLVLMKKNRFKISAILESMQNRGRLF